MLKQLEKVSSILTNALLTASAIGLVVMTIVVGWQVFGRYVLNSSPSWSEQFALVLMIWFTFLGTAVGVREGFHIRITALEDRISGKNHLIISKSGNVIMLVCSICMCWWGFELVARTWGHTIPSLGIPRGLGYLAIPMSGAITALFALEKIFIPTSNGNISSEEK